PQVDVSWTCDEKSAVTHITLKQHDVLGENGVWPVAGSIVLGFGNSEGQMDYQFTETTLEKVWDVPREITTRYGVPSCPVWIFANDYDYAYGRFLLDRRSREEVTINIGVVQDVFLRTLLWGSLWDSVREAQMAPQSYILLALALLSSEKDEPLVQSIID